MHGVFASGLTPNMAGASPEFMMLLVGKSDAHGGSGRLDMVGLSEGQQSAVSSVKTAQTIEFSVSNGYINFQPSTGYRNHGFLMNHLRISIWLVLNYKKTKVLPEKIPMVFADCAITPATR